MAIRKGWLVAAATGHLVSLPLDRFRPPCMTDTTNPSGASLEEAWGIERDECRGYLELSRNLRDLAARLVADGATADDLVQEAWLAALEGPPERVQNLNAWLRQVVRNLALRVRRRVQRQREVEAFWAPSEAVDPTSEWDRGSSYRLLREATETLRRPYREVLLQHFFEGRSVAEIARREDRPRETVKSQLRRGVLELRQCLDRRHGGDRSAWTFLLTPALAWRAKTDSGWTSWGLGAALVAVVAAPAFLGWWLRTPSTPPEDRTAARRTTDTRPPRVPLVRGDVPSPRRPSFSPQEARGEPPQAGAALAVRSLDFVVLEPDGSIVERSTARVWGRGKSLLGEFASDSFGSIRFDIHPTDLLGAPAVPGPHGGIMVTARPEGGAWSAQYLLPVPPEGRVFEFLSAGPGQTLRGVVVDEAGQPVNHASVAVEPDGPSLSRNAEGIPFSAPGYDTRTDRQGRYVLEGLPFRIHRMFVRGPELRPERRFLQGDEPSLEASFVLRRGSTLRGRVIHADGTPAAGIRVWDAGFKGRGEEAFSPQATTDQDGRYELRGVEPGACRLYACDPDAHDAFASTVLHLGSEDLWWNPTLEPNSGLRVRLEALDGSPIARASVGLVIEQAPAWGVIEHSDSEGAVWFPHVADAQLAISVERSNAATRFVQRDIRPDQGKLLLRVPEGPDQLSALRGTLVDSRGLPFRAATILSCSADRLSEVQVDPWTGAFDVESIEPGRYTLRALVEGHGGIDLGHDFEVRRGEDLELGVLRAPPTESVRLEWPMGVAPSSEEPWVIEVEGPCTERGQIVFLVEHPASEFDLAPGTYRLRPATGASSGAQHFEVLPGRSGHVRVGT